MSDKRVITEEEGIHEEWYKAAAEQTVETLPAFVSDLVTKYNHDYGTICHACAAAAFAAARAVDASSQGGITGFQAGCIMWEFIKRWMHKEGPLRLLQYEDMLYPQYEQDFRTISADTWKWLQEKAKENLAASHKDAGPSVVEHWTRIAEGVVPFGYTVESE